MGQGDPGDRGEAGLNAMRTRACRDLAEVRECIDALDRDIVERLVLRGDYVRQAAAFKADAEAVRAPARAAAVIAAAGDLAASRGGDRAVVERIYREVVAAFTDAELAEHDRK